jgi:hypothetical protein
MNRKPVERASQKNEKLEAGVYNEVFARNSGAQTSRARQAKASEF